MLLLCRQRGPGCPPRDASRRLGEGQSTFGSDRGRAQVVVRRRGQDLGDPWASGVGASPAPPTMVRVAVRFATPCVGPIRLRPDDSRDLHGKLLKARDTSWARNWSDSPAGAHPRPADEIRVPGELSIGGATTLVSDPLTCNKA